MPVSNIHSVWIWSPLAAPDSGFLPVQALGGQQMSIRLKSLGPCAPQQRPGLSSWLLPLTVAKAQPFADFQGVRSLCLAVSQINQ